jgi:hypothetical protein
MNKKKYIGRDRVTLRSRPTQGRNLLIQRDDLSRKVPTQQQRYLPKQQPCTGFCGGRQSTSPSREGPLPEGPSRGAKHALARMEPPQSLQWPTSPGDHDFSLELGDHYEMHRGSPAVGAEENGSGFLSAAMGNTLTAPSERSAGLNESSALEVYWLRAPSSCQSSELQKIAGKSALVARVFGVSPKTVRWSHHPRRPGAPQPACSERTMIARRCT